MSWFERQPTTATAVKMREEQLRHEMELQKVQMEMQMHQSHLQAALTQANHNQMLQNQLANQGMGGLYGGQPYAGQSIGVASHTHSLGSIPYPGGLTSVSSAGMGSLAGGYAVNPYAQQPVYPQTLVALPDEPTPGDRITLTFRGGQWREERSCFNEINKKKKNNSGDFSLDEIDEARELIDELSR